MKKWILIGCASMLFVMCAGCGSNVTDNNDAMPEETQVVEDMDGDNTPVETYGTDDEGGDW